MSRIRIAPLMIVAGLALAILLVPFPIQAEPTTHRLTITADNFAYDPPVLHVNRGDRVIVTLQAADVVHGFYLDSYGIDTRVEPGISQTVEFTADRVGKFRYRCSVSCGTLHPFMIGELIVGPNTPLIRAGGLAILAAVATLFFIRPLPSPAGSV